VRLHNRKNRPKCLSDRFDIINTLKRLGGGGKCAELNVHILLTIAINYVAKLLIKRTDKNIYLRFVVIIMISAIYARRIKLNERYLY
jgi:hypothetical protein